jgi:hypothetical protein
MVEGALGAVLLGTAWREYVVRGRRREKASHQ